MSIKFSEVIPSPKPMAFPVNDASKPLIAKSEAKKASVPASSDILLSQRNQILAQGTYIQARRDLQNVLKPIITKLDGMYGTNKNDETVSFRTFIEKNSPDIKKFDELLSDSIDNVKKGSFGFQHILNINKLFDLLDDIDKKSENSDESKQFKTQFKELKTGWDKLFNTTDNRTKFVYHLLKGIDFVEKLDDVIKKLAQSPANQNADLALFSERIGSSARNIRDVGGNITAYTQANNFEEHEFQKRVLELPDCFKEFTKILSEVAQNPSVQNNKEYVEILSNVYNHAMRLMQFFLPEVKKELDNYQKNIKTLPSDNADTSKSPDMPAKQNDKMLNEALIKAIQPAMMQSYVPQGKINDSEITPSSPMNTNQMLDYLKQNTQNPHIMTAPTTGRNMAHSPTSDDKELRALQGLWDWRDHAFNLNQKINAVNDIGQTMEEMAKSGSGRPNPEMVALAKRAGRLSSLQSLMGEVPKINKATQELEKSALEAQHAYMTGVNQIATQRLKLDIDAAHMQSEQQKVYQKGLEKLNLDSLEISTNMAKNYAKITGLFNEILMVRIDTVWDNIKRLTRGFKF